MPFTVTFPTSAPPPRLDEVATWLTEEGEPIELQPDAVLLRAMPVRLLVGALGLECQITVSPDLPLSRAVGLVFLLAQRLGAETHLVGAGDIDRAGLWLRLADEQDRRRIARILEQRAGTRGDEILHGLWQVLRAHGRGRDLRWETRRQCVIHLRPARTGPERPDDDEPTAVSHVALPVHDGAHLVAWRWLSEAYPSLLG